MTQTNTLSKGSRTYLTASLLTLSGGFLDAYTYFARGGVFANAQTGNIIKFAIQAAQGNTEKMLRYLIPVAAFSIGIFLAMDLERRMQKAGIRYIRRTVLFIEIILLVIDAFIPCTEAGNILADALISLVCAMQMEAFKTFDTGSFATVISTGNLRKAEENLYHALIEKDSVRLHTCLRYFFIVLLFITGVIIGTHCTSLMNIRASLIPAFLHTVTVIWITVRYHQLNKTQ